MAGICYKVHPSVYLAALVQYEKAHDYEKMKEIGVEALGKLARDLKMRGEVAIKTAQASRCVNDHSFMRKCWYEAFYSNSSIPNYLRLFVDRQAIDEYRIPAGNRIDEIKTTKNEYNYNKSETAENVIPDLDHKYLCFFDGRFEKIHSWCMEQKSPLGWTGNFIGHGIDLMLLYLYADNDPAKAVKAIAGRISNRIGFHEKKNLIFIAEDPVLESDGSKQKDYEIFWNTFSLWKSEYIISIDRVNANVAWVESIISNRVSAIVDGKYRNKYNDAALLVAALGEVKESLGVKRAKSNIINLYMTKYPRHTAFKGALTQFIR
jgi:hypothetical protein